MTARISAVAVVLAVLLAIPCPGASQGRSEALLVLVESGPNSIVRAFTRIALADVPKVPLMQPSLDVAMQKTVTGYQYWFHRQLDFRILVKQ